jgi:hypothetical protein
MKKNRQNTGNQTRSLQAQDLSAVRGGDNGVIHMQAIVGGGRANDNGVIQIQK